MIPDQQTAWDNEYRLKGRLWGTAPYEIFYPKKNEIIIELGAGDGKNLRCITGESSIIAAIDFSYQALKICKKDRYQVPINQVCANIKYMPFPDSIADKIIARHVIEHLTIHDRSIAAEEIFRILKPGGICEIVVFGAGDMRDGSGIMIEPGTYLRKNGIITHYFNINEIKALFEKMEEISLDEHWWSVRLKGSYKERSLISGVFSK